MVKWAVTEREVNKMNELLIRSIEIDWDMLSPDSWLHLLPAIASLDTLMLHRSDRKSVV